MKKIIVIVGPTASGKSEFAVKLAQKFNGEIISADSRQIYRGLDIGSGKVPGHWICKKSANAKRSLSICGFLYKDTPHHCIDFVSPQKTFTVAEYKKCADTAINDIVRCGKLPIIAGGTGFWIDALVYGLNLPAVSPNQKLRKRLEKKSTAKLFAILQKLDPRRARSIEQKNPRRLIRAIEIAKTLGKVPELKKRSRYDALWIGMKPRRNVLAKKIKRRVAMMIRKGITEETKKLLREGVSRNKIRELGFEYRSVLDYFDKNITRRELKNRMVRDSLKYVRRQITWFQRNKKINWVHKLSVAEKYVKRFI